MAIIGALPLTLTNGQPNDATQVMTLFNFLVSQVNTNATSATPEALLTPTVTFGGASVGVTYSAQTGSFTKIGSRTFFDITLILTSKGSSVGAAVITGLPSAVSSAGQPVTVRLSNVAGLSGAPTGLAAVGSSTVQLEQTSAGGSVIVQDTNFTNTTIVSITGFYR